MRITSIPQIYRHLNRWYEIVAVLIKYELASWIGRLGPDFAKDILKTPSKTAIARHRWETRLRMALSELGPTFIKLGQILSTRPDLVGVTLAEELQSLQADAPADPAPAVRKLIEAEFGRKIEELFDGFEEVPMASASIGQVHRATLKSGEKVVVKVLHAEIERKFSVDLDILAGLAQLAEMIPEFQPYRPRLLVGEFQRALRRELDFARELRNLQQFLHDFHGNPIVRFPKPYPELSTRRVLTMEFDRRPLAIGSEPFAERGLRHGGDRPPRRDDLPGDDFLERLLPCRSAPEQYTGDARRRDRDARLRHGRGGWTNNCRTIFANCYWRSAKPTRST